MPERFERLGFAQAFVAPRWFVFRARADVREDDHALTDDLYVPRSRVLIREPRRIVRLVAVPGADRDRGTDLERIRWDPPDRWTFAKLRVTDDERGTYRRSRIGPARTALRIERRRRWNVGRPPGRHADRALFVRVWARWAEALERDDRESLRRRRNGGGRPRSRSPSARRSAR